MECQGTHVEVWGQQSVFSKHSVVKSVPHNKQVAFPADTTHQPRSSSLILCAWILLVRCERRTQWRWLFFHSNGALAELTQSAGGDFSAAGSSKIFGAEGHFPKLPSLPLSTNVSGSFSSPIHSATLSGKIIHYLLNVLSMQHLMLAHSLLVFNLRHLFLTMAPMSFHFSLHVLWILHSLLAFFHKVLVIFRESSQFLSGSSRVIMSNMMDPTSGINLHPKF